MITAESCAWCGIPQRGHGQRWIVGIGWHGWTAPDKALISLRIRARFRAKGWLPYFCPTSGEVEHPRLGGFTVCCSRPDLHCDPTLVRRP
ncbi:hypothetical protein [Actinoplanes siamensis]|nr:hypothetical protein [Actinoplanes siamensis]